MNPQELQQKIAEYYAKLPKDAQDIFSSMQWLETLKSLSAKHNLNAEQIEILGTETTLVLLGIIHVEEYEKIINKEIRIQRNSLDELLADINDEILKPIRSKLTETFIKNSTEFETGDEQELLEDQPINPRLSVLPEETQQAIKNTNYQAKLFNIGRDNGLSIDKMDTLESLTIDVILNTVRPEDFVSVLGDTLQIDNTKSNEIAKEINEQILKEIRKSLIFSSEEDNAPEKTETEELLEAKQQVEKNKFESNQVYKVENIKPKEKEIIFSNSTELEIQPTELTEGNQVRKVEDMGKEKIAQKPIESLSAQKFSGSFKTEIKKTDYSLSNDLKKFSIPTNDTKSSTPVPTPPKPTTPKIDPYREMPE